MSSISRVTQHRWMHGLITMSADQEANLLLNDHIEFDTDDGDFIVSTGAGQADGLITLPGGHWYRVECRFRLDADTANGLMRVQAYDVTNAAGLGTLQGIAQSTGTAGTTSYQQVVHARFYLPTTIQMELRFTAVAAGAILNKVFALFTSCDIQEIPQR